MRAVSALSAAARHQKHSCISRYNRPNRASSYYHLLISFRHEYCAPKSFSTFAWQNSNEDDTCQQKEYQFDRGRSFQHGLDCPTSSKSRNEAGSFPKPTIVNIQSQTEDHNFERNNASNIPSGRYSTFSSNQSTNNDDIEAGRSMFQMSNILHDEMERQIEGIEQIPLGQLSSRHSNQIMDLMTELTKDAKGELPLPKQRRDWAVLCERMLKRVLDESESPLSHNSKDTLLRNGMYAMTMDAWSKTIHRRINKRSYHYVWEKADYVAAQRAESILNYMISRYRESSTQSSTIRSESEEPNECPRPDVVCYTTVINAHAKLGHYNAAYRLLKQMQHDGFCSPNGFAYSTVLQALANASPPTANRTLNTNHNNNRSNHNLDLMKKAEFLLSQMVQVYDDTGDETVLPTIRTYNTLLMIYMKHKCQHLVKELWQKLQNGQITISIRGDNALSQPRKLIIRPNNITYNIMQQNAQYSTPPHQTRNNSNDRWQRQHQHEQAIESAHKVEHILNTMIDNYHKETHQSSFSEGVNVHNVANNRTSTTDSMRPDVYAFQKVITAWSRTGVGATKCREILSLMEDLSVNGLMEGTGANSVGTRNKGDDDKPLLDQGRTINSTFGHNFKPTGTKAVTRGWGNKVRPDIWCYNAVLHAHSCQVAAASTACSMLREKELLELIRGVEDVWTQLQQRDEQYVSPDVVTYNSILDFCSKAAAASVKFSNQTSHSVADDVDATTSGNTSLAHQMALRGQDILREMTNVGLSPNARSYTAILNAYVNASRCTTLHHENDRTNELCSMEMMGQAEDILYSIPTHLLDSFCFLTVLNGWAKHTHTNSFSNNPERAQRAYQLFQYMNEVSRDQQTPSTKQPPPPERFQVSNKEYVIATNAVLQACASVGTPPSELMNRASSTAHKNSSIHSFESNQEPQTKHTQKQWDTVWLITNQLFRNICHRRHPPIDNHQYHDNQSQTRLVIQPNSNTMHAMITTCFNFYNHSLHSTSIPTENLPHAQQPEHTHTHVGSIATNTTSVLSIYQVDQVFDVACYAGLVSTAIWDLIKARYHNANGNIANSNNSDDFNSDRPPTKNTKTTRLDTPRWLLDKLMDNGTKQPEQTTKKQQPPKKQNEKSNSLTDWSYSSLPTHWTRNARG